MLENISVGRDSVEPRIVATRGVTESRPTNLSASALLTARLFCRPRPTKNAFRQIAYGGFPKLPRGAPGAFFAAEAIVTKQTRDRLTAAKKMNLKTVSLFFGARFRVDAPDVLFRIGISSFFHSVSL